MSCEGEHDDVLLNILRDKGQLVPFLDAVFGFLYRRTDFYIVQENTDANFGFPPGVAEKVVRNTFRKWQNLYLQDQQITSVQGDITDLVIHEEEVVTSEDVAEIVTELKKDIPIREDDIISETYNGADCGSYRWSQTYNEVDIKVPVPASVLKSSDVQVDIQSSRLSVAVRDTTEPWKTLVEGELTHKHLRDESIWTLHPGRQITIHLQKSGEKWWDSLLSAEQRLDLSRLDVSKHVTELPEEDHMQVEKVIVQEERKRRGLLMPEQQEKLNALQKAWNLDGSPFQGTPFDPSVLQLTP